VLVGVTGIAAIAALIVLSLSGMAVPAQIAPDFVPDWQKAAGGKLSFEVASIKLANPDKFTPPNFAMDFLDSFSGENPHGRMVAQFSLATYIAFAYKLFPYSQEQRDTEFAYVPKWVSSDQYAINANAAGNPTKDQMRLMMQSVLADRFKLAVHYERQEAPVLALVMDKPGKTGPKLNAHSNGLPCDVPGVFPIVCNAINAIDKPNNAIFFGARDLTMAQIAAALSTAGRLPRPVVDQTGLDGRYDFTLEWTRESSDPTHAEFQGTTYQEAIQDQLGLKLKSAKTFMDTLVIDHVERPTEN
jgi:uncharacterized protein (TIGR03435 family)